MLKNDTDTDEPPSPGPAMQAEDKDQVHPSLKTNARDNALPEQRDTAPVIHWLKSVIKGKQDNTASLREALEEYIEEITDQDSASIALHERALISNILTLRDLSVSDMMIPRADIVAVEINSTKEDLLALLAENQYSRIPVYRETLDDVVGAIHLKDVLSHLAGGKDFTVKSLTRECKIVSPAMPVLDLLMQMRQSRKHMALVVDEYGGIDGLVTIGDVIESIVGELDDEHDVTQTPALIDHGDGSITADARFDIEEFQQNYGNFLSSDEGEDIDTLGGLVFSIAGRVPARGEVLTHEDSGILFEVLDADPRRVNKLRIRNLPSHSLASA